MGVISLVVSRAFLMNEFCERFRLSRLSSWLGFDQNFSILAILFFKKRLNFFFPHVTLLSLHVLNTSEKERTSLLSARDWKNDATRVEEERYPRPKRAVIARTVLKAREKEEPNLVFTFEDSPWRGGWWSRGESSSSDTKRRNETFILRKERRGRERNNASAMCARRYLIDHPVWSDACAFTRTRDRIKMCDVCCDKALFVILWLFESPHVRIHTQKEKKPFSSAMSARSVLLHLIVWKGTSPLNSSCSFVVLKVYNVHTHTGNLLRAWNLRNFECLS